MSSGDDARTRILRRKKVAQAMEAAFDNEIDTFKRILEDPGKDNISVPIEPEKERDDSFLGEASCGNAIDIVQYLLERGANVNSIGAQGRTPLARACYNSAIETVPLLLEAGADPRLLLPQERDPDTNAIMFRPWDAEEVKGLGCCDAIMSTLRAWNIETTFQLLENNGKKKAAKEAQEEAQDVAKKEALEQSAQTLDDKLAATKLQYKEAMERREERILTYDTAKCEKRDNVDFPMLEGLIKESMAEVDQLKLKCDEIELQLRKAKAEVRTHVIESQGGMQFDLETTLDQLEDAVFNDIGSDIVKSGKHARLLVDPSGKGLTLITYRSATLVDIGNSHHMATEQLVLNILGCLKHGKPFVINIRDKDLPQALETLQAKLNAVKEGFFNDVMTHRVRDAKVYLQLVTDELEAAHPTLSKKSYSPVFAEKFTVTLVTSQPYPDEASQKTFFTVNLKA